MEKSFADLIEDLDDGIVANQLTEQLRTVVKAVMETSKKGAVTLTLTVACNNRARMAVLTADVKAKIPQAPTESTMFFTTEDGNLRRDDPRQPMLKHVDPKPPERKYKPVEPEIIAPAPEALRAVGKKVAEGIAKLEPGTTVRVSVGGEPVTEITNEKGE